MAGCQLQEDFVKRRETPKQKHLLTENRLPKGLRSNPNRKPIIVTKTRSNHQQVYDIQAARPLL